MATAGTATERAMAAATPARALPGGVRFALGGNFMLRIAGSATGILLTKYLAFINDEVAPLSAAVVGALTGAFYATELACAPLFGGLGDRRGWRGLLLLGPLLGVMALSLTAATTLIAVLLVTRLLEGLSAAASAPAILGQLAEATAGDPLGRNRALGIFEASTALGTLVGLAAATGLWIGFGRGAFLVVAGLYMVALGLFLPVRDRHPTGRARGGAAPSWRASLARIRDQPRILRFLPAWMGISAVTGLWFSHGLYQLQVVRPEGADQFLAGRFNGDDTGLSYALLTYALVFSVGVLLWGYLGLRRLREIPAMRIALGAMFGVCAALWALNHSGENAALRGSLLAAFLGLLLIESGFAPAAIAYLARLSGEIAGERGLVMGLYSVVSGGGSLLGAAIGAPFAQRLAFDGVLLATVLFAALSALVLGLAARATNEPSENAHRSLPRLRGARPTIGRAELNDPIGARVIAKRGSGTDAGQPCPDTE